MGESVDVSTWQYAVIALRTEPRRERLVIAYADEKTLRTLIAAPALSRWATTLVTRQSQTLTVARR
jgi:hypothetical protein